MTGRDAPATHELRSSLRKRMFLLDHGPGSHMPAEKRFNHQGVKPIQKSQMNANQLKKLQQTNANAKNNKLKGNGESFLSALLIRCLRYDGTLLKVVSKVLKVQEQQQGTLLRRVVLQVSRIWTSKPQSTEDSPLPTNQLPTTLSAST